MYLIGQYTEQGKKYLVFIKATPEDHDNGDPILQWSLLKITQPTANHNKFLSFCDDL